MYYNLSTKASCIGTRVEQQSELYETFVTNIELLPGTSGRAQTKRRSNISISAGGFQEVVPLIHSCHIDSSSQDSAYILLRECAA